MLGHTLISSYKMYEYEFQKKHATLLNSNFQN